MAKQPSPETLKLAAEWLTQYEGEDDENAEMAAVAEWLIAEAKKREKAKIDRLAIKQLAADRGTTSAKIKAALKAARARKKEIV